MNHLRKLLDKARPHFEKGGKLQALHSVFEGMESFLFISRQTAPRLGVHVHDAMDSKRTMILVIVALLPCLFFGMYNTGYQHWLAAGGGPGTFGQMMLYGFLSILPTVVVTYVVGLGIEFISAQIKGEEIQEGFLVTGLLIPLIIPVGTPLWMTAVATAFAVIFAKEVFGGTGYNIFNVALVARAFLFFAYPAQMSGDDVFVGTNTIYGIGPAVADGYTCATPLGQIASSIQGGVSLTGADGAPLSLSDAFFGLIPGSFGETSVLCVLIGGVFLLLMRIVSWRIIFSGIAGALAMGAVAHAFPTPTYPASYLSAVDHLMYGGFMFAIVFMATDPVTAARTNTGKLVYGFLIGVMAVLIRTYNTGYPEGAMLAVLLMNALAPLIDYCVVQANVHRRSLRARRCARVR